MQFDVETAWIAAIVLLALRLAPLFVLAPGLGSSTIPVTVRVGLTFAFAAMLVSAQPAWRAAVPLDLAGWLVAALAELVVGMAWAFGLFCAFGAFVFAGRLLDLQVGFGLATLFDPSSRTASPLLGTGLNLMALAIFFALDGHHGLIRTAADSLQTVPPGAGLARLQPAVIVAAFGSMFAFGLALVAPAVITLLLLDIGMGVVARTMPQMNIFIVGMPLKVAVGLFVLMLSAGQMGPVVRSVHEFLAGYLRQVLQ